MTQENEDTQVGAAKERLVTVKEAAQILGISVRGLYRLADLGEAPAVLKVGRSSRFSSSEIHAYIERLKEKRDTVARRCGGRSGLPRWQGSVR